MRIVFVFDEQDHLRHIRAVIRSAGEQIAAAAFIARIASTVQPDTVSTAADSGDANER